MVLPATVPGVKIDQCRAAGATLIVSGTTADGCLEIVHDLHAASGDEVIDAYDHHDVITGQGTASLELISQAAHVGAQLDALAVPVGGGGGVAGACLAAENAGIEVFGVEPSGCGCLTRSLAAGRPVTIQPAPTLADELMSARPGQLPYEIASARITGTTTVTDDSLRRAMFLAFIHLSLVLEPSGAAGLAAALDGAFAGFRNVGIILTGGNAEPALITQLISDHGGRPDDGTVLAPRP